MIELRTDLPIPNGKKSRNLAPEMRDAMTRMEVGQSFILMASDYPPDTVAATFYRMKKSIKGEFLITKKQDHVCIWKIKNA